MTDLERQYFDFGYALSKAAFSYAELARHSYDIQAVHTHATHLRMLSELCPVAVHDRQLVRDNLDRAYTDMRSLSASPKALALVKAAADELNKPLKYTGDAKTVAAAYPDAGKTLASLNEFERISGLSESPDVRNWLKVKRGNGSGNVWYAEGLIAGVCEIASDDGLPDLLPQVEELSTDMRGLRDWLASRTPDPPSEEQSALRETINGFLKSTSWPNVGDRPVSRAELLTLGDISHYLRDEVLAAPPPIQPTTASAQSTTPPSQIAAADKAQ